MTRNIFMKLIPAIVLSMIVSVGGLFAQTSGTGNITGVVSDTTGAVVKGATVTLTNKATNQTQTAETNGEGVYNFQLLQPGTYAVKTTSGSFGAVTLDVSVQVGRTTDANVTLGAAVSAVVEVTAEGVQSTTSNFDAVQNETAIKDLPINGRRFQDFATLTPSAQVDPSRGQISLSGQRGINSNVNVDGVDYNQPFFGGIRGGERSNSAFTLPQESIKEFQVVAAGYSAEFGRSTGGIVNAVTKSGSNDFHGSAFYLYRPEQLARGNEFTNALADQKLNALGIPATLAPTQKQFGGSIGGPIKRDRAFFFFSYEQQQYKAPRAVAYTNLIGLTTSNIPAASVEPFNAYKTTEVPFDQTNDARALLGRADFNLNDSNRLNVRYSYSRNNAKNGVSTGETQLDPTTFRSVGTNGTEGDKNNIIVAQFVSTISANLINEGRFQWAKEERPRDANVIQVGVITAIGELGTRNFLPTTQDDKRYQFVDSITAIHGGHTFKFGGEYSRIAVSQAFGFNQTGSYTFSGFNVISQVLDALSATPNGARRGRFDNSAARYNQQIGNLAAAFDISELAVFAQDSWRVTPKFTLNYGVRFEKQYNPAAEANNSPVINLIKATNFPLLGNRPIDPTLIPDSQNEWGPRLGFAYDIKGDGKSVLRGYSGIYYARTPAIVLAAPFNNFRTPAGDLTVQLGPGSFNATTFNQANFDAANPQYVAIMGAGQAPNTVYRQIAILGINLNTLNLTNLPTLTPAQLQTIADRIQAARTGAASTLGVFQNANVIGITPNYKNPVSYQFGGGYEQELWRDVVLGFDFSWVKTIHLERNIDINVPVPQGIDAFGRTLVNRNTVRPILDLGSIQLRDSSANALYRAFTTRIRINKTWGQINAFYTWSRSESDDDNERDSGGVLYSDPYTRAGEYNLSKLDRTHQFVANPVFFLPFGFEVSSGIRFRSGSPLTAIVGSDLNADGNTTERPLSQPGFEILRNSFRNRPLYDVDLRIQKGFTIHETKRLTFSAEFFNVLNRANIQIAQANTNSSVQYCRPAGAGGIEQFGQGNGAALGRCGLDGTTESNFLQIIDRRVLLGGVPNPNYGKLLITNNPGSQVFQVQLGARFNF